MSTTPNQLTTSLAEIRSFNPCVSGWRNILNARNHQCVADYQTQFPLVDCLASNSVSDVCWLLGKRRKEIQICMQFATMCADSVKDLDNHYSKVVAYAAADAAAYAAAYAAYTAAANATAAAYAAARKNNQQLTADICRKYLPIEIWNIKTETK